MLLWVIGAYLLIGIIVNIIAVYKEPLLLRLGCLFIPYFIVGVIIFPYPLWVIILFPDDSGRWI